MEHSPLRNASTAPAYNIKCSSVYSYTNLGISPIQQGVETGGMGAASPTVLNNIFHFLLYLLQKKVR